MAGAFDALFDAIAWVLAFFYDLIPNYGIAIIMLTLSVMVVMTPLTLKGTKSMMAMQRLQPEMKQIQDKYKDDREKLNEELLKFYKENSINPLGGCLPLFLQMPIFIVLFQVIRGLTRRVSELGIQTGWSSGDAVQGSALESAPAEVMEQPFDPAFLNETSAMYRDLAGSTSMDFLGIDLSRSASDALSQGVVGALPYFLMIGVVAFSGWYQQKQTMARSSSAPTDQQKMISRVMLIFLPVISFGLPAGVVLYFVISNLYRIGQQSYITHTMFKDKDDPIPAVSAKAPDAKASKKSGGDKSNGSGSKSSKGGSGTKSSKSTKSQKSGSGKGSGKKGKRTYTANPKGKKSKGRATPQATQPKARRKKRK